jgi:hypothetical protein
MKKLFVLVLFVVGVYGVAFGQAAAPVVDLYGAIYSGDVQRMTALLEGGVDPTPVSTSGKTILSHLRQPLPRIAQHSYACCSRTALIPWEETAHRTALCL